MLNIPVLCWTGFKGPPVGLCGGGGFTGGAGLCGGCLAGT